MIVPCAGIVILGPGEGEPATDAAAALEERCGRAAAWERAVKDRTCDRAYAELAGPASDRSFAPRFGSFASRPALRRRSTASGEIASCGGVAAARAAPEAENARTAGSAKRRSTFKRRFGAWFMGPPR